MFNIIYKLLDLGIEIYYMDTDSITINGTLPPELVGNGLGQFKLEHIIKHGYFISPKLYALETFDNKFIVKAKGIGNKLEFSQFETLINNTGIVKAQNRWFKDPVNATINLKNISLHISSLNLKRNQHLDNGRLSYTTPLKVEKDSII